MALALGWFAIATIFAETLTPKTQRFADDPGVQDAMSYDRLAGFAAAGAPLRGDLLADMAMARAAPALNVNKGALSPEIIAARRRALAIARQSLSFSPHSSSMWLLMAMLQSQDRPENSMPRR